MKKPVIKDYILSEFLYIKCLKKENTERGKKIRLVVTLKLRVIKNIKRAQGNGTVVNYTVEMATQLCKHIQIYLIVQLPLTIGQGLVPGCPSDTEI